MADSISASILGTSYFSVAPLTQAAGGGQFVSPEAQALQIAGDQGAARDAARNSGGSPNAERVAFDRNGELITSGQRRGGLLDVVA